MDTQSVHKTYKYRLYPTSEQEQVLDTVVWRCRTLYNVALEERKTAWERCGVSLNYRDQADELPDVKQACPEYNEVHSQVLQDVLKRLDRAFDAFFRRLKAGEKPGYPRFRSVRRFDSITFPSYGDGCRLTGNRLYVQGIGSLK